MRRFVRFKLSPSLVVASIALLVALGGTSVAAVNAVLPKNSVGTLQLKSNAVTSIKVANHSLKGLDFAIGQVPAGPAGSPGPKGPKGDKGDRGDRGLAGEKGPIGPSDAYSDTNAGPVALTYGPLQRVATVSAPAAGKYVLWGKATFHADASHTNLTSSVCVLATASTNQFDSAWTFVAPGGEGSIALTAAESFDQRTAVNLYCNVSGTSSVRDIKLIAIKVDTLTTSTG